MRRLETAIWEYDCPLLPFCLNQAVVASKNYWKLAGGRVSVDATEMKEGKARWAIDMGEWKALGKKCFQKFSEDKKFIAKVRKNTLEPSKELQKIHSKIEGNKIKSLSNARLKKTFDRLLELDLKMCDYGFTIVAVETVAGMLTKRLEEILRKKEKQKKLKRKKNDYFTIFTAPPELTLSGKERLEFLKLAKKAKTFSPQKIDSALFKHSKKYPWLTFGWRGPALTKDFFHEELMDLKQKNIEKMLENALNEKKNLKKELRRAEKELQLTPDEKYWVEFAGKTVFLKGYRKEAMILSYYLVDLIAKEASRRTFVPLNDLWFFTAEEFSAFLKTGKRLLKVETKKRQHYLVFLSGKGKKSVLTGKKAKNFWIKNVKQEKNSKGVRQLVGQIASPGLATGAVKIVNKASEMGKVEKGDILVSSATYPELMPAIMKCAAIITDQGGLTCHAAIVSRELNVPCVVGTKNATSILKDGDLVQVDASHGKVIKLKGGKRK